MRASVNLCRMLLRATCLTLALTLVLACQPKAQNDLAAKTLLYCSEGSPDLFNPQLVTSGTTIDAVSHQLYSRLVKIDSDTGQVVSDLARKVIISEDGKRYRFYLRKDVAFHSTAYFTPSRTLTTEDVAFSFGRIFKSSHPYNPVGGGQYPFFDGIGLASLIEQILVVDELTIEFRLNQPQASFLANMATDFAVILSAEYGEQLLAQGQPELIDQYPIGTGPYKFVEYKADHYIRYHAHEHYWADKGNVEQVVFDITPNNSSRVAKLLTQECDVLGYPSAADVTFLTNKPEVVLTETTSMNISYWAFNTNVAPFDNPNVRKALSYAVDRNAIIEAVYFNQAQTADSLLPPSNWAYQPSQVGDTYSLEKARAILRQEGLEQGFTMDIWAMPVQRVYNPNAGKMAEILQASLAKLNIEANIVTYDWGTFRKRLAKGEHDSVLIGWLADNSDPDNFFRPLLSCAAAESGSNRSGWCNKGYDDNIYQALSVTDPELRLAYYERAEQLISEQTPLVPIAHALRFKVYRNNISGVQFNPYGGISFERANKVQQ